MASVCFEERQGFHWFAYLATMGILIAMTAASLTAFTVSVEPVKPGEAWWVPLVIALGFLVILNVFYMRTTLSDGQILVQFGYLFPMYRKRIALSRIHHSRVVQYRPIRDAGGWGIRFGRFEKKSCRFLNSRGNRGLLIEMEDFRYIIGSQEPERLQAAIEAAQRAMPHRKQG